MLSTTQQRILGLGGSMVCLLLGGIWLGLRTARPPAATAAATGSVAPAAQRTSSSLSSAPAVGDRAQASIQPPTTAEPQTAARAPTFTAAPIRAEETAAFKPFVWPNGKPHYEGEPVAAYVRVGSSGEQAALSVSQGGEYPRVRVEPREEVQVRLRFEHTAPGTPIALAAQDGGRFADGQTGVMLRVDAARELAFPFAVSANEGTHRVTFTTPRGETKVLDFWAGPFNTPRQLSQK